MASGKNRVCFIKNRRETLDENTPLAASGKVSGTWQPLQPIPEPYGTSNQAPLPTNTVTVTTQQGMARPSLPTFLPPGSTAAKGRPGIHQQHLLGSHEQSLQDAVHVAGVAQID